MEWSLIADIGGTNTRIARLTDAGLSDIVVRPTDGPGGAAAAILAYAAGIDAPPARLVAACAGPVGDGFGRVTNCDQTLEAAALQAGTRAGAVRLINDFEAAAYAHAELDGAELTPIQGAPTAPRGHRLAIGPGTGLGVGALIDGPGGYRVVAGEGGHIGIGPMNRRQLPVFEAFARYWPEAAIGTGGLRFEAEAMLSGRGLPGLYRAAAEALGAPAPAGDAASILSAGRAGDDPAAALALEIFRDQLGAVAGDLALTINARGGVFFVGGVVAKNPWLLDERFRAAFNQGGRFTGLRSGYPIYLNTDGLACLKGAAYAARRAPV